MPRRAIASLVCLLALQGCAGGLMLDGVFAAGDETLTGSMSRYMGGGTIEIYGSRGTHCTGTMVFDGPIEASGRLLCDDRRSGPFALNVMNGKGHGDLNGRAFTFTLGKDRTRKRQSLPPALAG